MRKAIGLIIFFWGIADLIMFRLFAIDVYAVMGIRVPELIFPYTNIIACAIGSAVAGSSLFGSNPDEEVQPDQSERPSGPPQGPFRITGAFLWGGFAGIICLIAVYHVSPGTFLGEASARVTNSGAKTLLVGATHESRLPTQHLFFGTVAAWTFLALLGIAVLRLRGFISAFALLFGTVMLSTGFAIAMVKYPQVGYVVYSEKYIKQLHTRMGHPDGLPDDWWPWSSNRGIPKDFTKR